MMAKQRNSPIFGFRYHFPAAASWRRGVVQALLAMMLFGYAAAVYAQRDVLGNEGFLRATVAVDLRLESLGYRLITANAALCKSQMPATGIRPQSISDYAPRIRATARRVFGFATDSGVEVVVADGPAAISGIRPGDGLIRIGSFSVPVASVAADTQATLDRLSALYSALFALPPDQPIPFVVERDGKQLSVVVQPRPACRAQFEVVLGKGYMANADGELVRVGAGVMARLSDGKLAAIVAHEIAHNILGHAKLSEQQGVRDGIAGTFGRSARLTLAMEDAADRLSLRLMANAGFDPHDAIAMWREDGPAMSGWVSLDQSHRNWRSRAKLLEDELVAMRIEPPR